MPTSATTADDLADLAAHRARVVARLLATGLRPDLLRLLMPGLADAIDAAAAT